MAAYVVPRAIVVEVLSNDNYENWRWCMKCYFLAQGLWDIVEPTTGASDDKNAEVDSKAPDSEEAAKANSQTSDNQEAAPVVDPLTRPPSERGSEVDSKAPDNEEVAKADSHTTSDNQEGAGADTIASDSQEIATADSKAPDNQEGAQANSKKALANQERAQINSEAWSKRNAAALNAIQISCSPDILSKIRTIDSAKEAWVTLANMQKLQLQTAEPLLPGVNAGLVQNAYTRWLELNKHAYAGNWDSVKRFLDHHPNAINAKITSYGGTALHVATVGGNVKVVEKLVEFMSPEDLEIVDNYGFTALSYAACQGTTKMVKCMITKNKKLLNLPDGRGRIPRIASLEHKNGDIFRMLNL
ncbi:unnamed protein product [Dovyalis caffra]|uniref:DUF4219 domain-containing protein n=1 Tax=Dovyalis caffra TaxID=77055 RepID=A0AAV1QZ27_9ROSI|nr:unnamed protein product [Dovyalis caffra]